MSTKTITFEDAPFYCPLAKNYVAKHMTTPSKIPIISCEGSCLRGEIARRAANIIAYKIAPGKTVRICFQGVIGGGCEEKVLIEKADEVLFVEGCALRCSSRLVKGTMDIEAKTDIVVSDQLYKFNPMLFGIDEMPETEIKFHAESVAKKIAEENLGNVVS